MTKYVIKKPEEATNPVLVETSKRSYGVAILVGGTEILTILNYGKVYVWANHPPTKTGLSTDSDGKIMLEYASGDSPIIRRVSRCP